MIMYKRKTKDEFQLHVNYGQGWEYEICEDSYREAIAQKRCYRENCPEYPTKIVVKRVPLLHENH
jgi:hypothetical protein